MKMIRSVYGRATLLCALAAVFALSLVSSAAASPEYSKLTSEVKAEFLVIVPIVLTVLGVIIGIAFAIRWGMRKFGGTR